MRFKRNNELRDSVFRRILERVLEPLSCGEVLEYYENKGYCDEELEELEDDLKAYDNDLVDYYYDDHFGRAGLFDEIMEIYEFASIKASFKEILSEMKEELKGEELYWLQEIVSACTFSI